MIKNRVKKILLIWPIVLLIGFWGNSSYQRYQTDSKLLDANGYVWKAEKKQFVVQVDQRENGELLDIRIKVIDGEKKEIYTKTEIIDRDMFGGGFVRAVQVDNDSENEIVVWHARAKYYLDFSKGNVIEVPFDHVPQEVKELAVNWHKYNVMSGLAMASLLLFVLSYYILYILVLGFLKLFKRKKGQSKS